MSYIVFLFCSKDLDKAFVQWILLYVPVYIVFPSLNYCMCMQSTNKKQLYDFIHSFPLDLLQVVRHE